MKGKNLVFKEKKLVFIVLFCLFLTSCACICPSGQRCNEDGTCSSDSTEGELTPSFP